MNHSAGYWLGATTKLQRGRGHTKINPVAPLAGGNSHRKSRKNGDGKSVTAFPPPSELLGQKRRQVAPRSWLRLHHAARRHTRRPGPRPFFFRLVCHHAFGGQE